MHKSPPKPRFIAASYRVMTTTLAKEMNKTLALVKEELVRKDRLNIIKTAVKRCWFVNDFDEVCRWLKHLNRPTNSQLRGVDTFDFSTMYTTLELDDISRSVVSESR